MSIEVQVEEILRAASLIHRGTAPPPPARGIGVNPKDIKTILVTDVEEVCVNLYK